MATDATSRTDSRKHPHLISIRGSKEVETAFVSLANSLGLSKYEMLVKLLTFYLENNPLEQIIKDQAESIEAGYSSAVEALKAAAEKDEVEVKRGRPSVADKEAAKTA